MTNAPDAIPADEEAKGWIAESITEHYGERCPMFDPTCICCRVWQEFDRASRSPLAAPVAEGWRDIASAPKDGTRVLLVWKPVGGLSEHVELGKWSLSKGWANTYGREFSGDPDGWAPLAPFVFPAPGAAPSGTAEGWKPIETAPNGKSILLHYDDGEIVILEERDNDDEWLPYPGKQRFCSRPTHWMPLPAAPTPPSADSAQDVGELVEAARKIWPYLVWTIRTENSACHPTMPSAVAAFGNAFGFPEAAEERFARFKRSSTDGQS